MNRAVRAVALIVLAGVLIGVAGFVMKTPSGNRVWAPELAKTATADVDVHGLVHLHNVRDWTYATGTIQSVEWNDEVVLNPEAITRAWFVFEPFPSLPVAGHTYLTFEFADGTAYSFSIEARKEASESYSALKGLFREYELAYTWGTERDFLSRRLLYLGHPVHMYPLAADKVAAKTLFLSVVDETNKLAAAPRFYSTLTANCTNLLAEIANKSVPGSVPYDIAWNLPGFSEKFLRRIQLIPEGNYNLDPYRNDVQAFADKSPREFSQALRELPPLKKGLQNNTAE
jgi:hypothetical protein